MMPRRVRPFPLAELPRLLHSQVEGVRTLTRHVFPVLDAVLAADAHRPAPIQARLAQAAAGSFAITRYEVYLSPTQSAAELETRTRGGLGVVVERVGPAHFTALLLIDETLCSRLSWSAAALSALLREVFSGTPVRIVHPYSAANPDPLLLPGNLLCVDATLTTGAGVGWARLLCASRLRLQAPPPADPAEPALLVTRLHGVRLSLAVEIGHGSLPLSAVLALGVGDIVVLDHFGPRPVVGGPVYLRLGEGAFPAFLDGDGITITGPFCAPFRQKLGNSSLSKGDPVPPETLTPLLQEIAVVVTCEIGRVPMSGQEVLELRTGAVIPVGRPLAGPVDLRAGERLIARGELVDIEGELGVRLIEVIS